MKVFKSKKSFVSLIDKEDYTYLHINMQDVDTFILPTDDPIWALLIKYKNGKLVGNEPESYRIRSWNDFLKCLFAEMREYHSVKYVQGSKFVITD